MGGISVKNNKRKIFSLAAVLSITLTTFFHCKDNPSFADLPSQQTQRDSTFDIRNPIWSKDGTKIYGVGNVRDMDGDDLYQIDSAGGPVRLIMRDSLAKRVLVLSPNGEKIAYLAA